MASPGSGVFVCNVFAMNSMDSPGGLIVIDEGLFSSTGSTGYSQARVNAEVSDESDSSTIGECPD